MSIVRYSILLLLSLVLFSCNDENEGEPVVFIGDSLVEGWRTNRYFPSYNTTNKCVSGAHLKDAFSWDIDATDKTAVFLIGTNNLGSVSSLPENFYTEFVDLYLDLISSVNAERNIVISILPRIPSAHRSTINQEIKQLNSELKNTFSTYDNIIFLDVYDDFSDEESGANPLYFYDGLHLNDKGYDLLSSLLAPIL